MALLPKLPDGFHAQPAYHHIEGWQSYDFVRVYTPSRELDELRSYWLLNSNEDMRGPMPPHARFLSFVDWANHFHKGSLDYAEFESAQTALADVRGWLDAVQSTDLLKIPDLH